MNASVKETTEMYLAQMADIFEFRAYTQLAYMQFNEEVNKGLKIKTIIPTTNANIDQNQIRERLNNYEAGFLPKLAFQHSVSIFESWFFDILRIILSDKNRLNKKRKVEVSNIVSAESLDELKELIINEELNELQYKKISEWFDFLNSFVKINIPKNNEMKNLVEIKASRDILVHNNCIANKIYITKAGEFARGKEGATLTYDHKYAYKAWQDMKSVMESIGKSISKKIDK